MKPILLVEDNADDVFFMKRALRTANIQNPVLAFADGNAALDWLEILCADLQALPVKIPAVAFLDLNLPGKSGFELLRWIRTKSNFHRLRVITMISSLSTPESRITTQLGADACLLKPPTGAALLELCQKLNLLDIVSGGAAIANATGHNSAS